MYTNASCTSVVVQSYVVAIRFSGFALFAGIGNIPYCGYSSLLGTLTNPLSFPHTDISLINNVTFGANSGLHAEQHSYPMDSDHTSP